IQYDGNGSGTLFAGSFGRGLWSSPLFTGYIEPIKQALFEVDNPNPYVGDTVSFTDLSTNNPISWKWEFSPNTVTFLSGTSDTSQNPKVSFNAAGSYTVTLTATDADTSYTLTETDFIQAKDLLSVNVIANRTTVCSGDTTQLFAVMSGGSGKYNFNWSSKPLGWTSYEQNPIVKPFADSVVYKVTVYDGSLAVSGSIKIYREECTGINNNEALLGKVSVFPNPNAGHFEIRAEKEIYRVEIWNETGAKIYGRIIQDNKAVVNREFARGIYFVKVYLGNSSEVKGYVTKRLIIR
ncbi:MAG TPA: PKD domain-containing protein, partial [Bacteroidetes bacterium]|nr:PKD domain-containing protein [Bacteroidota bacterium]